MAGSVLTSFGQNLVSWNPSGLTGYGPDPWAATTTATNVIATGLDRASGVTTGGTAAGGGWGGVGWETGVSSNDFFTFTVKAAAGYELDFASLNLSYRRSNSGPPTGLLQYSLNGTTFVDISTLNFTSTSSSGATLPSVNLSNIAALQNVSSSTTVTFRIANSGGASGGTWYVYNSGLSIGGTVSAAGPTTNNSTISVSTNTVSFGRVMLNSSNPTDNVTISKVGTSTTSYTVTAGGQATVSGNGTSFATGSVTDPITVGINRTSVGAKTGTVTVDNTATDSAGAGQGSADANDVINVSGTVVANRTVTASSVNLGKGLVGATLTGTSTLSSTGIRTETADVTVGGGSNAAGVSVGGSTVFDSTETVDRTVTAVFTQSQAGGTTGSVNLATTGEAGLTGQTVGGVAVNYTADIYQVAEVRATANGGVETVVDEQNSVDHLVGNVTAGDELTIENGFAEGSGQRATIEVASVQVTENSGFGVTGQITQGAQILEGNGPLTSTVTFDTAGKLNGTHVGTIVVGLQNDQTIQGTYGVDLGTYRWEASFEVNNAPSNSGTAVVESGKSYEGLGLTADSAIGTQAELLAGTASGVKDVEMAFDTIAPGGFAAVNDALRVSDVISLTGTGGDLIVLQLTYDESMLNGLAEGDLRLGWLRGGEWVLAIDGNSMGSVASFYAGAYQSGYTLGAYGVDVNSNTVWAVIDHNSEFSVAAVPEPSTIALIGAVGLAFVVFRRRNKTA